MCSVPRYSLQVSSAVTNNENAESNILVHSGHSITVRMNWVNDTSLWSVTAYQFDDTN